MNARIVGAVVPICLLLAGAARAQTLGPGPITPLPTAGRIPEASGFGARGQVTIASDFAIAFTHSADADVSALYLDPALDYFIAPNVSLGGQLLLNYVKPASGSVSVIGIGPRVGLNLPLAAMFSLFMKAGLALDHYSINPDSGPSDGYTLFSFFINAPFLFHPVPHFFVGIGPTLSVDLAGGNSAQRDLTFGLLSTVGGWFDW